MTRLGRSLALPFNAPGYQPPARSVWRDSRGLSMHLYTTCLTGRAAIFNKKIFGELGEGAFAAKAYVHEFD